MSPKSNHDQEAKKNLEWKLLTTLRFITKESRVEVGKAAKGKREKQTRNRGQER